MAKAKIKARHAKMIGLAETLGRNVLLKREVVLHLSNFTTHSDSTIVHNGLLYKRTKIKSEKVLATVSNVYGNILRMECENCIAVEIKYYEFKIQAQLKVCELHYYQNLTDLVFKWVEYVE